MSDKYIFTDYTDYPCTSDKHRLYYTHENTIHRHNEQTDATAYSAGIRLSMLRGLIMNIQLIELCDKIRKDPTNAGYLLLLKMYSADEIKKALDILDKK